MICTDRGVFNFNLKLVQVTVRPCQCMPVRTHPGRGPAVPVATGLVHLSHCAVGLQCLTRCSSTRRRSQLARVSDSQSPVAFCLAYRSPLQVDDQSRIKSAHSASGSHWPGIGRDSRDVTAPWPLAPGYAGPWRPGRCRGLTSVALRPGAWPKPEAH